jgi:8-oxo-dGTP pyrophosphatase MutT (NUDIX family)
VIEAAGGVVWRVSGKGHVKVLLVHRPQYGDWSLPKGKVEQGEDPLTAALREVREETGLRCEVGIELPEVRYHDHKGRPKCVRYWAMRPGGGRFHRNHEVDRVRWVTVEEAASVMSYGHDVTVVAALADRLALTV